jgi:hypothetical protein
LFLNSSIGMLHVLQQETCTIQVLTANRCAVDTENWLVLAAAVASNASLRKLNLSENKFGKLPV